MQCNQFRRRDVEKDELSSPGFLARTVRTRYHRHWWLIHFIMFLLGCIRTTRGVDPGGTCYTLCTGGKQMRWYVPLRYTCLQGKDEQSKARGFKDACLLTWVIIGPVYKILLPLQNKILLLFRIWKKLQTLINNYSNYIYINIGHKTCTNRVVFEMSLKQYWFFSK
jgi:hypothetical protein